MWDSHICHEAFHDRNNSVRAFFARAVHSAVDARRCRRTSRRTATPGEKLGKVQRCPCGQVAAVALLASSRDVERVADPVSPENKPNIKPIPYQANPMLFRCHFQYTRIGVGKGNAKVVSVYFLAVFQ